MPHRTTIMTRVYGICLLAIGLTAALFSPGVSARSASPDVITQDLTLYVGEQQTFTPGYPVGDIQVLNPDVANFRVQAGRRELMLVGKGKGDTQLIVWDQKHVKRHEVHLIVRSRDEMKAEADLKDLLKDFPTVQVRRLGDKLVISGTVSTQSDLEAIGRIANVASADNLVRVVRAGYPGAPSTTGTGTATTAPEGPVTPPTTGPKAAAAPQIEYEVEVIEANVAFQSGTYGKGIEPSGRTLYKQTVRAAVGTDTDLTVPGAAITAKGSDNDKRDKRDKNAPGGATSIRLRV